MTFNLLRKFPNLKESQTKGMKTSIKHLAGSEAKFFKWSLKLYGTETDENSEEMRVGVRHAPLETEPTTTATTTTSTTTTTTRRTTTEKLVRLREKEVVADRGCVSTTINCTKTKEECRTFKWRRVAEVFCKCTPGLCLDVASHQGGKEFNLQCTMASGEDGGAVTVNRPLYCQFIPFFSYR